MKVIDGDAGNSVRRHKGRLLRVDGLREGISRGAHCRPLFLNHPPVTKVLKDFVETDWS
jgi:hypothetical protein